MPSLQWVEEKKFDSFVGSQLIEFERALISERLKAGIVRARAQGKSSGGHKRWNGIDVPKAIPIATRRANSSSEYGLLRHRTQMTFASRPSVGAGHSGIPPTSMGSETGGKVALQEPPRPLT
jgi:hypothetical protein